MTCQAEWLALLLHLCELREFFYPLRLIIDTWHQNFSENVMKVFESAFKLHESAIQLRSQRLELIARNIANVDTPAFKAQDIDFQSSLKKVLSDSEGSTVLVTHEKHLGGSSPRAEGEALFTVPFNTSIDGNTVEMSVEQAKYGRAAAKYQATLRFLESNIGGIRKALKGE